jgi:spore coat polysaccharide biosynthesis predicted glycosyltransferase SpsG
MPAHLAGADVAVLALGVTVYEALAAGVPAVVLCRSAADVAHASSLEERGAVVSLGIDPAPEQIAAAVAALVGDPERRAELARAGRALVDGRGAERIVGRLLAVMAEKEGGDARRLEA